VRSPAEVRRPWLPKSMKGKITPENAAAFVYVVVDEKVGDHVGLTVTRWPAADGLGRLRFDDQHKGLELAVSLKKLMAELYADLKVERPPRAGDVFAVRLSAKGWELLEKGEEMRWTDPILDLVDGPVHDISKEARKVAKLALYAIAGPILSPEDARAMELTGMEFGKRPVRSNGAHDRA
jgi:hypothetical protein